MIQGGKTQKPKYVRSVRDLILRVPIPLSGLPKGLVEVALRPPLVRSYYRGEYLKPYSGW